MSEAYHQLDDDSLLAQCEVQVHRAGGPGGQHRNKVETAIRLVHQPTGLVAEGKDQRSRTQNLRAALGRLRERLEKRAFVPKARTKTKPSKAAKRRRLEGKRHVSEKKQQRRGGGDD
ncbi:MAG: peptide chain release factor-like protein [Deltaproteobacteria bacterium]|nr:peptide chain release factor-like protein [Deltaproteobacteria bacterium]